jgi:hypothetical protein
MMFAVFANAYFIAVVHCHNSHSFFGVNHVVEIAEHLFQSIFGVDRLKLIL